MKFINFQWNLSNTVSEELKTYISYFKLGFLRSRLIVAICIFKLLMITIMELDVFRLSQMYLIDHCSKTPIQRILRVFVLKFKYLIFAEFYVVVFVFIISKSFLMIISYFYVSTVQL